MRIFKTSCIDNITKHEIILSDVSYNSACFWLYGKGFTDPEKTTADYKSNITTLEFLKPAARIFYYDENRGLLLGN